MGATECCQRLEVRLIKPFELLSKWIEELISNILVIESKLQGREDVRPADSLAPEGQCILIDDDQESRSEIEEVIQEETRRGRRPIDFEERRRLLQDFRTLLEIGTDEDFLRALRAIGLRDGSPEFVEAVRVWREKREP
jgi:hypothetical protein